MLYRKYLLYYAKRFKKPFALGIVALTVTNILDVIPPLILMRGIDQITAKAGLSALLETALLFAAVTLALALIRFHWRMQFGKYHQGLAADLRQKMYQKLTHLSMRFYNKNPIGELMSLMTNDVDAIRMGYGPGIVVLVDAFLYFLTIPPIMLYISVPLTLKSLIVLPLLPFIISWISHVINRRFTDVQSTFSQLSGLSQENISGIRVIKSYAQEENQIRIFNKASEAWQKANLKIAWPESFMQPVMEFSIAAGLVILLYFGSKDVASSTLTIGGFVALQRYISKMVWPMTAIGWGFSLISQAQASLTRVDEFLNTPIEILTPEPSNTPPAKHLGRRRMDQQNEDLSGPIEVRNLRFSYPDSQQVILRDISFTINPGEAIGIVGPVGSGKTTLVQLLCHLYKVDRGQIFFNNIDINDIPLENLRSYVSLVPQDTFLFSTTIRENLSFGTDADLSISTLDRVTHIAKLDNEIKNLPNSYETFLGERGINLSGGQKQRLSIARALLRRSPIIIFDDSLSAVDSETEALILKRLKEETKDLTTIIISHRLSSLSLCQKIIVLSQGRIEAIGSPQELKQQSFLFQELLELQGYQ